MSDELKVGDTVLMPLRVIRAYETNVTLKMPDYRGHICVTRDEIAAWNARAGGEPDAHIQMPGILSQESFPVVSFVDPTKWPEGSRIPVYRHPSPALDAGEVERLVREYGSSCWVDGRNDCDSPETTAARAALLAAVTAAKGGR